MDFSLVSRRMIALLILGSITMGMLQMDWFQAQGHCANRTKKLTKDTSANIHSYWTGRYQRVSGLMKLIGCFDKMDVIQHAAVSTTMEVGSAGYCQEICVKLNKYIFAIQKNTCLCLRSRGTGRGENVRKCNFTCSDAMNGKFSKECGGETAFNIYESEKHFNCDNRLRANTCVALQCISESSSDFRCETCSTSHRGICQPAGSSNLIENESYTSWESSMKECKDNHFGYLLGNLPLSNALNACSRVNKTLLSHTWIGVAKQKYLGIDQGFLIDTGEKSNFIKCEKCASNQCSFVDCTNETHRFVCSKINFSTVTYPNPSTTTTTEKITRTETTGTTITTTETSTTTTTNRTKYTQSSTITVIDSAGTDDHLESSTSNPGEKQTTGQRQIEVSVIVVPIIFILFGIILGGTGFIFWRRRKAKKEEEPVQENPTIYLNVNQGENEHGYHEENNVSNSSYFILEPKSPYDKCGNDIPQAENQYIEAKEGEYDHLGNNNRRRKVTENDDYDETTKDESFNRKVEEGNYDHLGNTSSRKSVADDTYCHTFSKQLDDSSDYDAASHMEQHDLENTYDHARAGTHLPNDSNYDYSELKQ